MSHRTSTQLALAFALCIVGMLAGSVTAKLVGQSTTVYTIVGAFGGFFGGMIVAILEEQ